jgi:hypothetical protein
MADRDTKPDPDLLAALVGQKNAASLDPSDPAYVIAALFHTTVNDALAAMAKTVADAAQEIDKTIVLAENAARARSETIVTEAARWSSEQIRTAGAEAAKLILQQAEDQVERVQSAAQTVRWGVWIACGASAASLCAMLVVLFK